MIKTLPAPAKAALRSWCEERDIPNVVTAMDGDQVVAVAEHIIAEESNFPDEAA